MLHAALNDANFDAWIHTRAGPQCLCARLPVGPRDLVDGALCLVDEVSVEQVVKAVHLGGECLAIVGERVNDVIGDDGRDGPSFRQRR